MLGLVCILFSCVSARVLGLTDAVGDALGVRWRVLDCSKCMCFWCVLLYMWAYVGAGFLEGLGTAFAGAWTGMWLEMCAGYAGVKYSELYEKIFTNETGDDKAPATGGDECAEGGMPDVRKEGRAGTENKT